MCRSIDREVDGWMDGYKTDGQTSYLERSLRPKTTVVSALLESFGNIIKRYLHIDICIMKL